MRILIFTEGFWPEIGGLEVFGMRLVSGMKARGHQCMVITHRNYPGSEGLMSYEGIPVHGFDMHLARQSVDLSVMRATQMKIQELVGQFNPDVVHLNVIVHGSLHFSMLQRVRKRPVVWTIHESNMFRRGSSMCLKLLQLVNKVIAVSEATREDIVNGYPEFAGITGTILNALPESGSAPEPLPGNQDIFCCGRLVTNKGFDVAIRAFAKIAERFPRARMTIAGDGSERPELESLARETGFGSRIQFTGWIAADHVPGWMSRHQMVVMPSRWKEPFGLVALQAAQMGRPILASNVGGLLEIVQHGITGMLFENEDDLALAEAMALILDDPELACRMGKEAKARALEHFGFDGFLSRYENEYQQAIEECARGNRALLSETNP